MTDLHATAAALIVNVHDGLVFAAPNTLRRLKHAELVDLAIILARQARPSDPVRTSVTPEVSGDRLIALAIDKATRHYGVLASDLVSPNRQARVATARHVACWLARDAGATSVAIGRALNRDHTTVLASCHRVERSHALLAVARTLRDRQRQETVA